ncbi:Sulfotransferase family protein [Shimia gijangensis]|uniref:Sulfotransferase family protein n=1 Tax=Shimia gijangensis TaxID=1470563 RepID=A0A1M6PPU6_9RHOB|nr:sulfotransferase family 2 domain-containing protein [Shimia gijangensis]SHK09986.1 Sulfotransferase family protein [Shimia gijangensis]
MLVFWKEKLVLLSVPKTGTTALEKALAPLASIVVSDPPELKHAPVYRYNRFFRPMFEKACKEDNMETVAVMREPVSWLGSWYRFRRRDFMKGRPNSTHDVSFDEFVEAYVRGVRPCFSNVGSQAKFLEPRPNGTSVKHLFRYEDQAKLLAFLQDRLDTQIALSRENVSPPMELRLSPRVETQLRSRCPAEFELYESLS